MNILFVLFMFLCGVCNAVPGQHSYLHEKCWEYWSCAGKSKDGFRLLRRNDGMTNDFVMRNSFGETCGVARCVFKPDGTMEIPFLESGEDVLNTTSDVLPFGDIPNTALTAPTSAIAKPSITSVPKKRRSCTIMCSAGEDVQNPGERCGVIVFNGQEVRFYRNGTCWCGKVGSFDFESREEREALAAFSVPSVFEENSRESLPAVSTEKGDVERKSEVSEPKEELGENKAEDVRSQRAQFCEEKRGDPEMQIKEKVREKVGLQKTVPGCKQGKVKEGSSEPVLQLENKNYESLLSERGGGLLGTEVTVEKSLNSQSSALSHHSQQYHSVSETEPEVTERLMSEKALYVGEVSPSKGKENSLYVPSVVEKGGERYELVVAQESFTRSDKAPMNTLSNMASNSGESGVLSPLHKGGGALPADAFLLLQKPTYIAFKQWRYVMVSLPQEVAPDWVSITYMP